MPQEKEELTNGTADVHMMQEQANMLLVILAELHSFL